MVRQVLREQGRDPTDWVRDAAERVDPAAARELPEVKELEDSLRQQLARAA
jgi:hypothetical protein